MLLDCATFGLAFNGKDSYLRHGMHALELVVNVCFLVDVFGGGRAFGALGVARLVYALELSELLAKTATTTKVLLKSLIRSLPAIVRLMSIELVFFYALGIVNVNFFRGKFHYCDMSLVPGTRG